MLYNKSFPRSYDELAEFKSIFNDNLPFQSSVHFSDWFESLAAS